MSGYLYPVTPLGLPLAGNFTFRVTQGTVVLLGATISAPSEWFEFSYPLSVTSLPVAYPVSDVCVIETSSVLPEIPADHPLIVAPDLGLAAVDRKILVCGAKGQGKSTFVRHLLNTQVGGGQRVVFVDIDPGQPEMGSPGVLSFSVIGNFNFKFGISDQPEHSYLYGHLSPAQDIGKFLEIVRTIGNCIGNRPEISGLHVVVNSHGWLQGLGEFSVQAAVVHLEISSVLKISSDVVAPFWTTTENPFLDESEISSLSSRKYRTQISVSPPNKTQISAQELRWLRVASCLRTNFRSTNFQGMQLAEFFDCHYSLRLPLDCVLWSGASSADRAVQAEALTGSILGLLDVGNFFLGLGFVVCVTDEHCVVLVTEKIDRQAVVRAERPSFTFSPRDTNFFDKTGSGLKEGIKEEPFWCSELLGGLESGARNLKNRQNLSRKRLRQN